MNRHVIFLASLCLCAIALGTVTRAHAERRALVIGNAAYADAPLKNPVNDARAMAAKLKSLQFQVTKIENLKRDDVGATMTGFFSSIRPGDEVVVFYAGHGLQVKGVNYLPAVDARIKSEFDVAANSLNLNDLLSSLDEAKAGVKLIFLDACRNNPFAHSVRGGDRGLARLGDVAASGTMIQYATKPGSVAADGTGSNGLYTQQLLLALNEANEPVEQTLKRAAAGVKRASHGDQEPWAEGSLEGDFCFGDCDRQGAHAPTASAPAREPSASSHGNVAPPVARIEVLPDPVEQAFWGEARKSGGKEDYAAYVQAYPNGAHASEARDAIEQLDQAAQSAARMDEEKAWTEAQSGNDWISYSGYLGRYPSGRYATLARFKLSKLPLPPPFRDCAECPEMVMVPSGRFEMGSRDGEPVRLPSEGPVHEVTVGAFALGKYSVTQGQWRALMGSSPSYFSKCGDNCPVEQVSWDDAQAYIRKLSERTGKKYRLPSEAEWEYACHAGSHQTYCGSDSIDAVAWYDFGSTPHPVGQKQANAWGLYDMSGNVFQWVQDCWHANYSGASPDGSAWEEGSCAQRVLRGGSWGSNPPGVRAALRYKDSPGNRVNNIGFRLARTLP